MFRVYGLPQNTLHLVSVSGENTSRPLGRAIQTCVEDFRRPDSTRMSADDLRIGVGDALVVASHVCYAYSFRDRERESLLSGFFFARESLLSLGMCCFGVLLSTNSSLVVSKSAVLN